MNLRDRFSPDHRLVELLGQTEWVRRLALRLLGDAAAADDMAQEAMVAAIAGAPPSGEPLRPWLAGVVRRLVARSVREKVHRGDREYRAAQDGSRDRAEDHAAGLARAEAHQNLIAHVMALDERDRVLLIQRYFQGRSPAEIAQREGRTRSAISSQLTRAHAELRARLEADGGKSSWVGALAPLVRPGEGRTAMVASKSAIGAVVWSASGLTATVAVAVTAAVLAFLLMNRPGPGGGTGPLAPDAEAEGPRSEVAKVDAPTDDLGRARSAIPGAPPAGESAPAARPNTAESGTEQNAIGEQATGTDVVVQTIGVDGIHVAGVPVLLSLPNTSAPLVLGAPRGEGQIAFGLTDSNGQWTARSVRPGQYSLSIQRTYTEKQLIELDPGVLTECTVWQTAKQAGCSHSITIEVPEGQQSQAHTLTVHNSLYISGRVLTDGEGDMREISISASRTAGRSKHRTSGAADGSFRIGPLMPGSYIVDAHDSTGVFTLGDRRRITAGATDVELTMGTGAVVSGRVLHPEEGTAWSAWISVTQNDANGHITFGYSGSVDSTDGGSYRYGELRPGRYKIAVFSKDGRFYGAVDQLDVLSGTTVEDLDVPLFPSFAIKVTAASGEGIKAAALDGRREVVALGIGAGKTRTLAVPPGSYTLRLSNSDGTRQEDRVLEAVAGGKMEAEF